MASVRKRRNTPSVYKREAPDQNEEGRPTKSVPRKRKLSDMLGPQWSKKELENFYKAYRKYGMDWKKVASSVHSRTAEMVAALYSMNKAYLSLPDRDGSVAGFIAMMIDHYNMLDISNSDGDSSEEYEGSKNPKQQSQSNNKLSNANSSDDCYSTMHTRSLPVFGCSPPGKKRTGGRRSCTVGKRTSLFHSSYIGEKKSETLPFCKGELGLGSNGDIDDSEVAKTAAMTLAEASFQATSPQALRIPSRRSHDVKYSSFQNGDLKNSSAGMESEESGPKDSESARLESGLEGFQEHSEGGKKVLTKSRRPALGGNFGRKSAYNVKSKMKPHMKFSESQGPEQSCLDHASEECTRTSGIIGVKENEKFIYVDSIDNLGKKSQSQKPRKKSRQLSSGVGNFGLNALATLANLSLNGSLPQPLVGPDSLQQLQEENNGNDLLQKEQISAEDVAKVDVAIINQASSLEQERYSQVKDAVKSVELATKQTVEDKIVNVESNMQHTSSLAESRKRKMKGGAEKSDQVGAIGESCSAETEKMEGQISVGDEGKSGKKVKQMTNTNLSLEKCKQVDVVELYDLDHERASDVCAMESAHQDASVIEASVSNQCCCRQTLEMEKASLEKADRVSEHCGNISCNLDSDTNKIVGSCHAHNMMDELAITKARLSHCLSSVKLRRWCAYEWFYSGIDLPWFEKNEFVEYLNHAHLGCVPRLTRAEWGVIRSSLGKPRRLSERFLQEEREKLEKYRESVRDIYNKMRSGDCDSVPVDLALPSYVGQKVIACHPTSREIHHGSILAVDQNRFRVQFDRPELGIEFVLDIDCMRMSPSDKLSETLAGKMGAWNDLCQSAVDTKSDAKFRTGGPDSYVTASLNENIYDPKAVTAFANPSHSCGPRSNQVDMMDSLKQVDVYENELPTAVQQAIYNWPSSLPQLQDREADNNALACLNCALDKKEALLMELRYMNDEISKSEKNGEILRNSVAFRKQYAYVLVQLKIINDQVIYALRSLRRRNTYQVNMVPPWHYPVSQSRGIESSSSSEQAASVSLDRGLNVGVIVTNAKRKARVMVDIALQVMSSLREDEDAVVKLRLALDSVTSFHAGFSSARMKVMPGSSESDSMKVAGHEGSNFPKSLSIPFGPKVADDAYAGKNELSSDRNEGFLLGKLTASCLATLILIQTCSDRQFPPAEVANVLDEAVRSLQPCSTANCIIYREIQQYMGIVKNQILTLLPTQSNISVSRDVSAEM